MAGPDVDFWQTRFARGDTPWDRGAPGPWLLRALDQGLVKPGQRVLVPGCGSGHDVAALARAGLQVTGLDYASEALARTRARLASDGLDDHPDLVLADALTWQPAHPFDVIYEQTCWCALHPDHWLTYAAQLYRWLTDDGQLWFMAMQAQRPGAAQGLIEGPPYHTDVHALRAALPGTDWAWPAPPYERVPHPMGMVELALVLSKQRR
jgi:methyl halide transferase